MVGEGYTQLKDRFLLWNGVSVVSHLRESGFFRSLLAKCTPAFTRVFKLTPELVQFNAFTETPIAQFEAVSDLPVNFDTSVSIPEQYRDIDIEGKLADLHYEYTINFSPEDKKQYNNIFVQELNWFKVNNKYDVLLTVNYIVAKLTEHDIAYGVGRGSSVYSYLLFLLKLHSIDPVYHKLDHKEFLR